jgi:hypothetical protein
MLGFVLCFEVPFEVPVVVSKSVYVLRVSSCIAPDSLPNANLGRCICDEPVDGRLRVFRPMKTRLLRVTKRVLEYLCVLHKKESKGEQE